MGEDISKQSGWMKSAVAGLVLVSGVLGWTGDKIVGKLGNIEFILTTITVNQAKLDGRVDALDQRVVVIEQLHKYEFEQHMGTLKNGYPKH